MRLAFAAMFIFTAAAYGANERDIAEWVLRWEGSVVIEGKSQPLYDVSQLPPGDVQITSIDLTAGVMHPAELRKLAGLTHLKALYLPGPIWNPGAGNEDKTGVFEALMAQSERTALHAMQSVQGESVFFQQLARPRSYLQSVHR
jgi:hypothetical protein